MARSPIVIAFILLLVMPQATTLAQSSEPARRQVRLEQLLPIEGIWTFLAFEKEIGDEELVAARRVLLQTYASRKALEAGVQRGDDNMALVLETARVRQEMVDSLTTVLEIELAEQIRQTLNADAAKRNALKRAGGDSTASPDTSSARSFRGF